MPDFDLSHLLLYDVFYATRFDFWDFDRQSLEFALVPQPPPDLPMYSCLWDQYVGRFVLNKDGTLDHVGFAFYQGDDNWFLQDGLERVPGNFYLGMCVPEEWGRRMWCIPFNDGIVETDETKWEAVETPI